METSDKAEAEDEPVQKSKFGGDERREEAQRLERRTQDDDRRRRRREDSEPRLFIACDDNQDALESADKSGTPQPSHMEKSTHIHTLSVDMHPLQKYHIAYTYPRAVTYYHRTGGHES